MAYFSNSSEGEIFDEQCYNCIFGDEPCEVALMQLTYNYDQFTNGKPNKLAEIMNLFVDKKGICKLRERLIKRGLFNPEQLKLEI